MAPSALTVEFDADGRCSVTRLTAFARAAASPPALQQRRNGAASAVGASGGFRCPLPYLELGSAPVDLRVVLAAGVDRPADSFPRLDWRRDGATWVGTASLPSSPSFVDLGRGGAPPQGGARFGWNFYGFFVFAAAFILFYLASVRWMRRGAPAPAR